MVQLSKRRQFFGGIIYPIAGLVLGLGSSNAMANEDFICFEGVSDAENGWDILAPNLTLRKRGALGFALCSLFNGESKRQAAIVMGAGPNGPEAYFAFNQTLETANGTLFKLQVDAGYVGDEHASFDGSSLSGPDLFDTLTQDINGLGAIAHLRIHHNFIVKAFGAEDGSGVQGLYHVNKNWTVGTGFAHVNGANQTDFYTGYFWDRYGLEGQVTHRDDIDPVRWAVGASVSHDISENWNVTHAWAVGTGVLQNFNTDFGLRGQLTVSRKVRIGPVISYIGPTVSLDSKNDFQVNFRFQLLDFRHKRFRPLSPSIE